MFKKARHGVIWRKTRLRRYEIPHSVSVRRGSRHSASRRAISRRGARFLRMRQVCVQNMNTLCALPKMRGSFTSENHSKDNKPISLGTLSVTPSRIPYLFSEQVSRRRVSRHRSLRTSLEKKDSVLDKYQASLIMNPESSLSRSSTSFRQSSASKIDQLYEISYVPDDSKIPITSMPLVNPYSVFSKPNNSLSKKVKKLIGSTSAQQIKEFVQASRFDSHQLPATTSEHLVTLSLPPDLPRHCLAQGYTHIHFGAIRLALTFHGRKGPPAFSRIALVDTRFVEYQHACIGTIQTTLNAGTIFVTFYPNFNMPLNDPSIHTALKAQIQIGGTPQVNTFQATFHYQMAYRVQNHSLDIMVPDQEHAGDALFVDVNSSATPTCTYVPRQLSREELLKLLPEKWITNYEQIHQAPVQTTTAPDFIRHENGQVEVRFSQEKRNVFPTSYMVQPLKSKGTKHFQYDICDCHDCLEEAYKIEYEEDIPKKKRSQQKLKERYESGDSTIGLLGEPSGKFDYYVRYGDAPVPTSKASFDLPPDLLKNQPQGECHVITPSPSTQEYEDEFPPLSSFEITQQRTKHDWKIKTPTTIGPTGQPTQIGPAKCTLNWQSENAVAQNKVLKRILTQQSKSMKTQETLVSKVQTLEVIIDEIRVRMQGLHEELLRMVQARTPAQTQNVLASKEAEMKFLKTQLVDLERQHKQQRMSMQIDDPWRLPTTPFVGTSFNPQPLALAPVSQKTPSLSIWSKEQEKRKTKKSLPPQAFEKTVVASSSSQDDYYEDTSMVASSKPPTVLPIQKVNPISSFLQSLTREETLPKAPCVAPVIATSSHVDNDLSEAFEHLFMTEPETTTPMEEEEVYEPEDEASRTTPQRRTTKAPKGDSKQTFTFDDIPPSQWRDRSMEMLTWCTAELQHYDIEMVVKRFLTRIQGRLRDWYMSLGEYRQMQLLQSPSPEALLHTIYAEFIGNPIEHTVRAREEFLKMKCCSFRLKDLETHYNNMSKRFYCLNGIDDTNLKQVFLNSFPPSLANEVYRTLETKNITVTQTTLGELYQMIISSLQKLCNQKKFLAEFERTGKRLGSVCDDKHLQIKCKDNSSCECSRKKKSHFRKSRSSSKKVFSRRNLRKKKWKFIRKKSHKGRTTDRCFICNKKGHFAKDCKNRKKSQALLQALNQIEPVDISDLESLYSLDDEPSDEALCTIIYSEPSSDEESDTSMSDDYSESEVFMTNSFPTQSEVFMTKPLHFPYAIQPRSLASTPSVLPLLRPQPTPLAKVHLLTSTFAKPIPVIAFFDTGSSVSILDPDILPSDYWKPHHQHFLAANGDTFVIDKISIPIYVRLFPKCVIKHRFLGSSSHGKDLLVGFDILHTLPNIRFAKEGLRYKSFLNPWSSVPKLYMATSVNTEVIKQQIIQTSCASSHTEFLTKNKNPLWLNPSFFVSLPFKQNEDVNPTKASHPGMNPEHYQLAIKECTELVEQSIIEPTTSPWACEAFYVNKRSEQVRGKLRLVINYQPLNHFLADDKFPLPQKRSLFQSLANAKILSKFDLKAGFWQLGIQPEDRPKTAFCIPDHHYQWKVMPFELKNAPSAFQKAMVKVFEPILNNTLVYIDDILLFSPDEESHVALLSKFHSIIQEYGIMLSEKKMEIGVTSINFLGMKISDGKYQPQPHIAQELHKFPDELTTPKEIQQFLGLVNYMADFLPKLSTHIVHLFPMLKKNPPPWSETQTLTVRAIKQLADVMPPLKIPATTDKRILQTDASDEYWGAVLLVQDEHNVRRICGYKSGTFKPSEHHYHSTFKEILAVKRGIEKFQFHLIGHHFQIEMDMSSFPKMLQFKRKMLPEAQLLRWSNWFSQWQFTVKHIKGTENILADFLSRPKSYKYGGPSSVLQHKILPMVLSTDKASSSSQNNPANPNNPPAAHEALPPEILEGIADATLKHRALPNYQTFFQIALKNHGPFMKNFKFHPDYPYLTIFHIHDLNRFPKEALCFFWYLFEAHTIAISFNAYKLFDYLFACYIGQAPPQYKNLYKLFEWFLPGNQWI
ncbi:hypothetical protein OSB04_014802 [Centaurea solstitialis]|uniref:Reverse transcriptase n=1 Tax=Centaurea solstitialis TaxID=347529 RepID=A0AA38W8C1_9ASTR|nr:hypothetical protein OSB04_014802 [Centaurea solstitialis]